jgi:hypothetical protein
MSFSKNFIEFFKEFYKIIQEHSLPSEQTKKRNRKFAMSESEIMTILIFFHSEYKNILIVSSAD